ncbi:gamma-glutamyl-gamma-aminobutyrate hydrolase family protein [Desulfoscipio geothermicus]|nr:gamma-glutamyl-gamma-aminobutyrate hydrolase family protein [Desulfoscipio geothermicus]
MSRQGERTENIIPLIGVTTHVDTGSKYDLFPGRALNYMDRTYADVLIAHGMLPVLIPVNMDSNYINLLLRTIGGLVCTGGGKIPSHILNQTEIPGLRDTAPERYEFEELLFAKALEMDMPMLAMCRGMQTINELLGGSLFLKISHNSPCAMEHNQLKLSIPLEEPYHQIFIDKESYLARILGQTEIYVNSWHSQSVKQPGKGLKVVARSKDHIIEAMESEVNSFVLMLQFHPEILVRKQRVWSNLFTEFRRRAIIFKQRKESV